MQSCLACRVCGRDGQGVCKVCKRVAYCSSECKDVDWLAGHANVCTTSSWLGRTKITSEIDGWFFIDGRFQVTRDPDQVFDDKDRVKLGPSDVSGVKLLRAITDRLENVTTEEGWRLAQDFFSSMRIVLLDVKASAVRLLLKTRSQLTEAADRWARLAALDRRGGLGIMNEGQGGGPGERLLELTSLQKWQVARARDDKNETAADRIILYLLDREASLEEVIKAANMLLGPPFVLEEHEVAASVAMSSPRRLRNERVLQEARAHPRLVQYVREEPIQGLGFDDPVRVWRPDNPGIYLLYDWDVETAQGRDEIAVGDLPPAFFKEDDVTTTVERVALARITWLRDFRDELLQIADLIGLDDIKGSVATFIQTLIVSPVSSRRGFMNGAILGEPGTGKTEIATRMPQIFYRLGYAPRRYPSDSVAITSKADWVAPYEGQSSHQARMTMLRGLGRVIVLDEAYSLVTDDADGFGRESLTQIVNDLDELRGLALFLLLGYEDGMKALFSANKGLVRRVPNVWTIAPYTAFELVRIILQTAKKMEFRVPLNMELSRDLNDLVKELHDAGLFASINAGAASAIMNVYRGIYSRQRFAALGREALRVDTPLLDETILVMAIVAYARDRGVYVWAEPRGDSEETSTPVLSRTEGIPSIKPVKGMKAVPVSPPRQRKVTFKEPATKEEDKTPPLPSSSSPKEKEEEGETPKPKMVLPPDPPKIVRRPKKRQ